jgi:hypothetical protein
MPKVTDKPAQGVRDQDEKSQQPAGPRGFRKTDVGGPGPHGSSDPATAAKNKNKPLLSEWGKGDKH